MDTNGDPSSTGLDVVNLSFDAQTAGTAENGMGLDLGAKTEGEGQEATDGEGNTVVVSSVGPCFTSLIDGTDEADTAEFKTSKSTSEQQSETETGSHGNGAASVLKDVKPGVENGAAEEQATASRAQEGESENLTEPAVETPVEQTAESPDEVVKAETVDPSDPNLQTQPMQEPETRPEVEGHDDEEPKTEVNEEEVKDREEGQRPEEVKQEACDPEPEVELEPVVVQSIAQVSEENTEEFDFELPRQQSEDQQQLQPPVINIQPATPDSKHARNLTEPLQDTDKAEADDEFGFDLPPLETSAAETAQRHSPEGASADPVQKDSQEMSDQSPASETQTSDQNKDPVAALVSSGLLEKESESSVAPPSEAVQAATAEWDTVQTITPGLQDGESSAAGQKPADVQGSEAVTFPQALEHMKSSNMDQFKSQIRTSVPRRGFSALKFMFFGTKLNKDLVAERDLVFCMAACPFINDDTTHQRVLQTIYKRLTGSKFDCQRFGGHWEQIGFQGNDPATDLRGVGFLGLMQLLYFVTNPKTSSLAVDVYKLSLHETQNFPFCLMGLNLTRLCIQTLREDLLNKECNRGRSVVDVLNTYYVGAYLHLYSIWKTQHKTITDTGFVLQEVETHAKKNPRVIIKIPDTQIEQKKQGSKVTVDDEPIKFTDVCDDKAAKAD